MGVEGVRHLSFYPWAQWVLGLDNSSGFASLCSVDGKGSVFLSMPYTSKKSTLKGPI